MPAPVSCHEHRNVSAETFRSLARAWSLWTCARLQLSTDAITRLWHDLTPATLRP
jgi:hypothetical protein